MNFKITLLFSFDVDLLPLFNGVHFIMVLTWTNNGGVFELLINGVLHSRIRDIETNGEITGQSRFIIGGSDVKSRNFAGYFHYFNVWDKVGLRYIIHITSQHIMYSRSVMLSVQWRRQRDNWGGGANIYIFVFTDHKNNEFQKKLIIQNTKI